MKNPYLPGVPSQFDYGRELVPPQIGDTSLPTCVEQVESEAPEPLEVAQAPAAVPEPDAEPEPAVVDWRAQLGVYPVSRLRELALAEGLSGTSQMRKAELLDTLVRHFEAK